MTDNERINYLVGQFGKLAEQVRELQNRIDDIVRQMQDLKEKK